MNLISRLYDVSKGTLLVGGQNVKNYDLKVLRDNVAVVLQKNVLFSGTIADNLRWGDINATEEEMRKACDIAQASEFVDQLKDGFNTWIEQGGSNVSGGEKFRVSYKEYLNEIFKSYGLSIRFLSTWIMAEKNYYCGYYADSNKLEDLLHFRSKNLSVYYNTTLEKYRHSIFRFLSSM